MGSSPSKSKQSPEKPRQVCQKYTDIGSSSEEEQIRKIAQEDRELGFKDTSSDNVFSLIFQADEFLNRTEEFDKWIDHWRSQSNTDDKPLLEYLGLRGHIQGELGRIQEMLLDKDPNLVKLNTFENSWPDVVKKLKTLIRQQSNMTEKEASNKVEEIINKDDNDSDDSHLPFGIGEVSLDQGSQTATFSVNVNGILKGEGVQTSCGTDSPERGEIGIQSDIPLETEEELNRRHRKEEEKVNKVYQNSLVNKKLANKLSKESLDKLLEDHTAAIQALRRRQEKQRKNIQENLMMKQKQRKHQRANKNNDNNIDEEDEIEGSLLKYADENNSLDDGTYDPEKKKEIEKNTRYIFENCENMSKEEILKMLAMDDTSSIESDNETEEMERENTESFIKQIGRGECDEEEILLSIRKHLLTKQELKERLALEKDLHKANINKMQNSRRINQSNGAAADENTDNDTVSAKKFEQLSKLDRKLAKQIGSKGNLSDEELKELIENYRKQRSTINNMRNLEREKNTNSVQQLKADREKRNSKKESEKISSQKDIDYSKMDVETMFELIMNKQASGELTFDAFQELMLAYTKRLNKEKKKKKQKVDHSDISMAQATESILKEHGEQAKQIKEIQDNEANKFKKQLEEKKKERREKLN